MTPQEYFKAWQPDATLAPREVAVLKLLMQGLSLKEIAYELKIAYGTVAVHKTRIRRKMDGAGINNYLFHFWMQFSNDYAKHIYQMNVVIDHYVGNNPPIDAVSKHVVNPGWQQP